MAAHVQLILGSTRKARISPQVGEWLLEQAKAFPNLQIEVVDLAEVNLPLFDEPKSPQMGDYQNDHTKAWSEIVKPAQGFIFLTAEYNAGYPASLKNAIDYLYHEWKEKPALVVSYGYGGGASAQQQLIAVLNRIGMKVVEPAGALFITQQGFNEQGALANPTELFAAYEAEIKASLTALDAMFAA